MSDGFPQLRVRTEFSFRGFSGVNVYGPIPAVVARLQALAAPVAAIVDGSTWGHTRWAAALAKANIRPAFGFETSISQPDGRLPAAWALALEDVRELNKLSTACRAEDADRRELFRAAAGRVLRFAGSALDDPETFDYVDLNPASRVAALRSLALADRTGKPLVATGLNGFPAPEDARRYLALGGRASPALQWIPGQDEVIDALLPVVGRDAMDSAIAGAHEVAARLGSTLPRAPMIEVPGDLRAEVERGRLDRLSRGHIREWTPEYQARVERELTLIEEKSYQSYFLVVADLVRWAKQRMLVGPARGSSAGSLVCYLLRITEVDPLVHNLLFERFIDVNRFDLPDIDIDFADTKRDQVFTYLADKYGRDRVARLGNILTLKPRSAIAEVGKRLGIPSSATFDLSNVLVEHSSGDSRYGKGLEDTLTGTAPGRAFAEKFPAAWLMADVENHAWHTGVHAAGVVVCNEPISNFATVGPDGVAHTDKHGAEDLNLLKIDALGLRTLGVIEDSGVVTAEQLYALTLDDPEVFEVINQRKFSGIFQFEGATQRGVAAQIHIDSFKRIDHITALARPGPLGGGASNHYIQRAAGREEVEYRHPSMAPYLGATMGVILYQEQVMRIGAELGGMSWKEVTLMRKAMSGRKGKEFFDQLRATFLAGATSRGIPLADAEAIWDEINNFGAWGMNASHTVSYGVISYWCAWMKRYYPLEYAAACLRGAKDDDQAMEVLREMVAEGVRYVAFDVDRSDVSWAVVDGELIGGFQNVRGIGPIMAAKYVEQRRNGELSAETRAKIAAMPVQFSDLRPAHTRWGELYADPSLAGVHHGRIKEFAEMPNHGFRDSDVAICLVKKRTRRDRNEEILIKRRGGKRQEGQTLFLDIMVVDDSVSKPVTLRIHERDWERVGAKLADRLVDDEDWLLVRGRWMKEFNMMLVEKVRCLNRPEVLE